MSLFDLIFGKKHECPDGDSCDSERKAIETRLQNAGLIDEHGEPTRIYVQYDEITPEIITEIRLVVGYDVAYKIDVPDMKKRAELAMLLRMYNAKA